MSLGIIFDEVLRDRAALFSRIDRGESLRDLARALIVIIAGSAAVFGAAVGFYKGGVQILFAAIKMPFVLLLTAAICAPSWSALRAAMGAEASLKSDLVRVLGGLSMVSLVLASLAPFLLVGVVVEASYHSMAIGLVLCAALAGAAGVVVLVRSRAVTAYGIPLSMFLAAFVMVGAQMSWTLRPYLVRPRTPQVVFVRALEGGLIESAARSWRSAKGDYERDHAPLPGEEPSWQ